MTDPEIDPKIEEATPPIGARAAASVVVGAIHLLTGPRRHHQSRGMILPHLRLLMMKEREEEVEEVVVVAIVVLYQMEILDVLVLHGTGRSQQ